jgi:hypothetical protein
MCTQSHFVFGDYAKRVTLTLLETPNGHNYMARVASLPHFASRVYFPVLSLNVVRDFLLHRTGRFVSIGLLHGLGKVHNVFIC